MAIVPSSLRAEKQAWLRFLFGLIGLTLAFGAAIFSTVFRQVGYLWTSAILASVALLLAGMVGLTTVPYLMRRVAVHRVREAFDYEVTREGLIYLALTLIIGIAALNTGNNLLFIVLSAMLAAILVSGVASAAMVRGLRVECSLPEHAFAGGGTLARIALHNTRRRLPAFSVWVVPGRSRATRRFRWQRSVFAFPASRPPERQWVRIADLTLKLVAETDVQPAIFQHRMYFPLVRAKASVARELELTFPRRGLYSQHEFGVSTRFPFSFLVKTRRVPAAAVESTLEASKANKGRELIVYPRVAPTDELFEVLPMITGEFEAFVRGRGHDLYRIREYMPEDSARHVDWKATARSGGLKVREFTREDERKLRIVFDNPAHGDVSDVAYERGIALAASLAWHFAGEQTELSFAASGYNGGADIYGFLRYLALVEPSAGKPEQAPLLETLELTDDYNVVLTARPRGSIPTALWACSYFLFFHDAG